MSDGLMQLKDHQFGELWTAMAANGLRSVVGATGCDAAIDLTWSVASGGWPGGAADLDVAMLAVRCARAVRMNGRVELASDLSRFGIPNDVSAILMQGWVAAIDADGLGLSLHSIAQTEAPVLRWRIIRGEERLHRAKGSWNSARSNRSA